MESIPPWLHGDGSVELSGEDGGYDGPLYIELP